MDRWCPSSWLVALVASSALCAWTATSVAVAPPKVGPRCAFRELVTLRSELRRVEAEQEQLSEPGPHMLSAEGRRLLAQLYVDGDVLRTELDRCRVALP